MPRYFFHIQNGFGFARDEEGQELRDLDQAISVGIAGARSLLSEEILSGSLDLRGRIEVVDEGGQHAATVLFSDAVALKTGKLPPTSQQSGAAR